MLSFTQCLEIGFSFLAIILNLTLIPLILFRSNKSIGNYKYLLLSLVFTEILYAWVVATTLLAIDVNKYGWVLCSTTGIDPWLAHYFFVGGTGLFVSVTCILTYSFIYRYAAVCRNELFSWFRKPLKVSVLIGFNLFVTILFGAEMGLFYRPSPEVSERLNYGLDNVNLTENGYMGILLFNDDGSRKTLPIIILSTWFLMFSFFGGIFVFVTLKIRKAFKNCNANLSESTVKLQKLLFQMLFLQTLVPVVCQMTPIFISYSLAYLHIPGGLIMQSYSSLFCFVPALDPLLVYIYMTDYRRSVIQLLYHCKVMKRPVLRTQITELATTSKTNSMN